MSRKRNTRSFCLILLLFAETIQAFTPDLASVASARLVQMIEPMVERGGAWVACHLDDRHAPSRTEATPPLEGPVPWRDTEPDEVCLASFSTASEIAESESVDAQESADLPFRSPQVADPLKAALPGGFLPGDEGHRSLLDLLCRLTC